MFFLNFFFLIRIQFSLIIYNILSSLTIAIVLNLHITQLLLWPAPLQVALPRHQLPGRRLLGALLSMSCESHSFSWRPLPLMCYFLELLNLWNWNVRRLVS